MGYKQTLLRVYSLFESFAASFTAVNTIGGIRNLFTFGLRLGGPQAYWITYISSSVFVVITALVLAEVCSALPAAGSIYLWAAASGGKHFGRFFGFLVAFWATTAWTSFIASNSQSISYYILSEIAVFELDFSTDVNDIKFRAVQWIVSEGVLVISLIINYIPPTWYRWVFRIGTFIVVSDFILNIIWLPIGVSKTYGFQSAKFVFTDYENYSGGSDSLAWILCFFATGGIQVGFDASGHVAEETKHASTVAARGILTSCVACILVGLACVFLFLFCTPDLNILFALDAPQPMIQFYALALGQRAHVAMTVVTVLASFSAQCVSIVAASRLIYAIARDGVLPFSSWIGRLDPKTKQPANSITFLGVVAAILLCSILPSSLAFQSLVSAAGVPTIASWGLISFGLCFFTKNLKPKYSLGVFSKPFQFISFVWNTFLTAILLTPQEFPVTSQNLNYSPIILGIVSLFAVIAYFVISEDRWFKISKHIPEHLAEGK